MTNEQGATFEPVSVSAFLRDLNDAVAIGYLEECFAYHRRAMKRFTVSDDWETIHYHSYRLVWVRERAQYVCLDAEAAA